MNPSFFKDWNFPKSEAQLKEERLSTIRQRIQVYGDDTLVDEFFYALTDDINYDYVTPCGWTLREWYDEIKKEMDRRGL